MIKSKYKAFLFDLNGTIIDDMPFHIKAWHSILNNLGAPITEEETKLQCYGKNHELLERIFPNRFSSKEQDEISFEKERIYQSAYKPQLKLIEGLDDFLKLTQQENIDMAIGSAAIMFNINFILDGLQLHSYFKAIVSADDVSISKPHPETFLNCATLLNVAPENCLVFEDSPKGTIAAKQAGMDSVVITTMHTPNEFDNTNVIEFVDKYSIDLFNKLLNKN